jgi:hypothetical protein
VIVFTWLSLQQVDNEQVLIREGQVTDRYNAAVTNIGDDSLEVRLGGIYALQRIMEDSPRDQPTIVNVLSTYIRTHAKNPERETGPLPGPTSDVQAALTTLGNRNHAHDRDAQVDLHSTNLVSVNLRDADLRGANLASANLASANVRDADVAGADLRGANLRDANLASATLRGVTSSGADLRDAFLSFAYLRDANLSSVNLRGADLSYADLRGADLAGADLAGADLAGADLSDAKR